jgi:pantoate--beta-alanine ligase
MATKLLTNLVQLRAERPQWSGQIGLVPTMGALHDGHAALVRQSVQENDYTVVSIFVNPTQFGPQEDFERYPRDLVADQKLLESLGANAIFAPATMDIYPHPPSYITFAIRELDQKLCARSRPGHMHGVLQVVSILFNLVQPHRAYFGLKDYQQQLIIRRMVEELHFPLQVVPCPIVRETDGLAMSSRNQYLNPEQRQQALTLSQLLSQVKLCRSRWESLAQIEAYVHRSLEASPEVQLDYFEVLRGEDLSQPAQLAAEEHPIAFIAAWLGQTRLIDNMPLWEYPLVAQPAEIG